MKYLTQRSYIGRTGVSLHRVSGVVSPASSSGWRHHETSLYTAAVLAAPVARDEENIPAKLNVVILALSLRLL